MLVELEQTMTWRTTNKTVTFAHPFRLSEFDEPFPAGRYSIETDEELLDGISFPVYVRRATKMQLIADPRRPGITERAMIDPQQLEEALQADTAMASSAEPDEMRPMIAPGLVAEGGAQSEECVVDSHLARTEP
jgi:hypothetical protein